MARINANRLRSGAKVAKNRVASGRATLAHGTRALKEFSWGFQRGSTSLHTHPRGGYPMRVGKSYRLGHATGSRSLRAGAGLTVAGVAYGSARGGSYYERRKQRSKKPLTAKQRQQRRNAAKKSRR